MKLAKLLHTSAITILLCAFSLTATFAQVIKGLEPLFTTPLNYVVHYTTSKLTVDGKLTEKAWQTAAWTSSFTDIEGDVKPKPKFTTKVKMLWDDNYLYIAAQLQEPQVFAYQKHHDDVIFRDNDFEVFINPDNTTHRYFEIEFNALNKTFDLFLPKPYRNGGDALVGWNVDGLKSAVHINGTLNNPADKDKGWTLEMAIPFKALWIHYPYIAPKEGSLWRTNFSRVEWDTEANNGQIVKMRDAKGNNLPEHNWVWSPQGVVDMHYPERWGYLQFTKSNAVFVMPYSEKQKNVLWLVYYRQKQHLQAKKHYAANLAELGIESTITIDNQTNQLTMEANNHQFKAWIATGKETGISINDEGLIQYPKTNDQ